MSARIIDGAGIAKGIRADVAKRVARLAQSGVRPGLAAILLGEDPASHIYVRTKRAACAETGIADASHVLPASTSQSDLEALVERLNKDRAVHGMITQLPLPAHIDPHRVLERIDPKKDADGFHPYNVGRLLEGRPLFVSATPKGIVRLLHEAKVKTAGAHAVIVGRSNIVGKPVAALLVQKGADCTVTVAHSRTKDLGAVTRVADILIVATGQPDLIRRNMVRDNAVVIDVGMNRVPDPQHPKGQRLVGDVAFEEVSEVASAITPVPGGVGPMTVAMLLENVVEAAERASASR